MKVGDGSRADGSDPLDGETLQKEGVDNPRSSVFLFGRLKRLGCSKHMPLPRPCILLLLRKVKDLPYMTPACPGSGRMCLFLFPSVCLYVSLLGKLRQVSIWLTAESGDAKRKEEKSLFSRTPRSGRLLERCIPFPMFLRGFSWSVACPLKGFGQVILNPDLY